MRPVHTAVPTATPPATPTLTRMPTAMATAASLVVIRVVDAASGQSVPDAVVNLALFRLPTTVCKGHARPIDTWQFISVDAPAARERIVVMLGFTVISQGSLINQQIKPADSKT
jgi:hypothetical protein